MKAPVKHSPATSLALWFSLGLIVGFIGFRIAGERYYAEQNGLLLRDRWTGNLYQMDGLNWRELRR